MSDDESIVLKPRRVFEDAILTQNSNALAEFMDEPLPVIAEVITGAIAAGPKAWMAQTGHLVQGILKGRLLKQVGLEIKELREKGKIPDDFADEKKHRYGFKSWVELLTIIDEETPDADRLEALKAMFYGVNNVNATDAEQIVNYLLFQIAKRLNSGELLLLRVCFDRFKGNNYNPNLGATLSLRDWANMTAHAQGHGLASLVLRDEKKLIEEGLLSERGNSPDLGTDRQIVFEASARMTDLGIRFCNQIQAYHNETSL